VGGGGDKGGGSGGAGDGAGMIGRRITVSGLSPPGSSLEGSSKRTGAAQGSVVSYEPSRGAASYLVAFDVTSPGVGSKEVEAEELWLDLSVQQWAYILKNRTGV
jgi:hypothetical protein